MLKKISIDKAYFGVKLFELSYSSHKERKIETYNLFDFGRVKWSVAKYVVMGKEKRKSLANNPLRFCFGDTAGRCEYECIVRPMVSKREHEKKVDIYQMYVEPNADYLMSIVGRISVSSAQKYLREERRHRQCR